MIKIIKIALAAVAAFLLAVAFDVLSDDAGVMLRGCRFEAERRNPDLPTSHVKRNHEIVVCMRSAGFEIDEKNASCKLRPAEHDVTPTIAGCYRPTGWFAGVAHDVISWFK